MRSRPADEMAARPALLLSSWPLPDWDSSSSSSSFARIGIDTLDELTVELLAVVCACPECQRGSSPSEIQFSCRESYNFEGVISRVRKYVKTALRS